MIKEALDVTVCAVVNVAQCDNAPLSGQRLSMSCICNQTVLGRRLFMLTFIVACSGCQGDKSKLPEVANQPWNSLQAQQEDLNSVYKLGGKSRPGYETLYGINSNAC